MDNTQASIQKVGETLQRYNAGVIVLQANPTVDAIAASTALYLGLIKIGKQVSIACSNPPQSTLTAADKIQQSLVSGGDNLVISFPYTEGAIDKVDYNIQGNFFNLVVVPRVGHPKLDPDKVSYSYTGGKTEYFVTIDVPNLNSIGTLYTENQNDFQGKNIVNIDRHLINNAYGIVNLVQKTSSSTSELVYQVIQHMEIEIDKDMATNLYTGLLAATNNFTSYSVNPQTFESASALLKMGAVKKAGGQQPMPQGSMGMGSPMIPGNSFGQQPQQQGGGFQYPQPMQQQGFGQQRAPFPQSPFPQQSAFPQQQQGFGNQKPQFQPPRPQQQAPQSFAPSPQFDQKPIFQPRQPQKQQAFPGQEFSKNDMEQRFQQEEEYRKREEALQRKNIQQQNQDKQNGQKQGDRRPDQRPEKRQNQHESSHSKKQQNPSRQQNQQQKHNLRPQKPPKYEEPEEIPMDLPEEQPPGQKQNPQDWLKPKIFDGKGLG